MFLFKDVDTCEIKDDDVEMEEEDEEDSEMRVEGEGGPMLQKAKPAVTSRTVTLNTLMDDGVIQPGKGVLSIDYLVRTNKSFY